MQRLMKDKVSNLTGQYIVFISLKQLKQYIKI